MLIYVTDTLSNVACPADGYSSRGAAVGGDKRRAYAALEKGKSERARCRYALTRWGAFLFSFRMTEAWVLPTVTACRAKVSTESSSPPP